MRNRVWCTAWSGRQPTLQTLLQVDKLLHGVENVVCADAGYTGVEKRSEHAGREVIWQVAARRSTYRNSARTARSTKPSARLKRPRRRCGPRSSTHSVIKCQFGYVKVRFRGLAKNTAQLMTLFALSNLWMARRHLIATAGEVRL